MALLSALALAQAAAEPLPAGAIDDARALAARAAAALAPAGARIEVLAGAPDPRLKLAPCTRVEAWWPAGSRAWGRTRVGLRCTLGASAWNIYLPLTVKVFAAAPVGVAPLPAGTVIEAGHLQIAEIDWAADNSPVITQAGALLGRTLARALGAGEPVRAQDLKPRQWFAAGDTVRIDATGAGFAVSAEGQALSAGLDGQPVRVRTDSGRIVSGVAAGERRIEVPL